MGLRHRRRAAEEGAALLGRALDLGYNHLDTARIYGAGQNEALIGETLKGRRGEFFLASKCGITVDGPRRGVDCSPQAIAEAIDESLRLPGPTTSISTTCTGSTRKCRSRIGRRAGAGDRGRQDRRLRRLRMVRARISARRTRRTRWARCRPSIRCGRATSSSACCETCRELGIALVAFSPVGRGALPGVLRDPATLEDRTSGPRCRVQRRRTGRTTSR